MEGCGGGEVRGLVVRGVEEAEPEGCWVGCWVMSESGVVRVRVCRGCGTCLVEAGGLIGCRLEVKLERGEAVELPASSWDVSRGRVSESVVFGVCLGGE